MEYVLNGEVKSTIEQATLQQILNDHIKVVPSGIAVAVDDEIVPRIKWDTYQILENQKILIITATQGG